MRNQYACRLPLGIFTVVSALFVANLKADDAVVTAPSEELRAAFKLAPFYQKAIVFGGFPIVSSDKVSDYALREAAFIVDQMLIGRDDIRQALVANKVRMAIMSPTELTCDIPEHSDLNPPAYWNRRARGLGSTRERPAVSCGEENLLALKGDPYPAESIIVHEFGHAIHDMGMVNVDPGFDARLKTVYREALDEGLWKGTYAASNHHEYWAEGVQSWFNTNRANDHDHNDIDNREKLKVYDPRLCVLLAEVFPKNDWSYVKPTKRTVAAHLTGFDREAAPKFSWPADVIKQFDEYEGKKKK